jgi:hypothetical protein
MAPSTNNCPAYEDLSAPVNTIETLQAGAQGRTLLQQYIAVGRFFWRETMSRWRQRRRLRHASPHRALPSL